MSEQFRRFPVGNSFLSLKDIYMVVYSLYDL